MRRLNGQDLICGCRLVRYAKIKEALAGIVNMIRSGAKDTVVGFELIVEVLGNLSDPEAEKALWAFLAGPLEMDPQELAKTDALEIFDKVEALGEVIGKDDWLAFFERLSKMMR